MEDKSLIKAGVSVGNPYCLLVSARKIKGTIYDVLLTKILAKKLGQIRLAYEKCAEKKEMNIERALNAKNLYEFDDNFTRKVYGYETVDTYYRKFSSVEKIKSIKMPLLGISALDDPIAHKEAFPIDEFKINPNTLLLVT